MKRILTTILIPMTVAIFFTGCSSLSGDAGVDMSEIQSSALQEAVTDENGDSRLDMNEEKETMPDYFEKNMTEKFKDLGGKPAFRMKDGHSQKTDDIEAFFIAGLRTDKTFVYGYTTRVGNGDDGGETESAGDGTESAGDETESAGVETESARDEAESAGDGTENAGDGTESAGDGTESAGNEAESAGDGIESAGDGTEDGAGGEDKDSQVPMVHCGAFYNYDTGDFQVFHETTFIPSQEENGEDRESFFMQMGETDGQVFVYDNGHGYMYDSQGNLKFHGDIETFVRANLGDVYSAAVVNAVTDWQNRIYLEVSIEKEKIEVPQPKDTEVPVATSLNALKNIGGSAATAANAQKEGEESEEEEDDKEAEELEEKIESRIVVYEYKPVNTGLDQNNDAFEAQKNAWTAMTAGTEYSSSPDGLADWYRVKEGIPDVWGNAFLGGLEKKPSVFQWKDKAEFSKEDKVTSLLPKARTYIPLRDVKEYWDVEKLFIMMDDKYSGLYGKTQHFRYYNPQSVERSYTLVWETELVDEKGNPAGTEKHSETHTQTLYNINVSRYAQLTNGYTESYWMLDQKKAMSLGPCIGGEILCQGKDNKVRWIQPGGKFKDTPYEVREDREAGAFLENGVVYYVNYGRTFMMVGRDRVHGGKEKDEKEILYKDLAGSYSSMDTVYDKMFEDDMTGSLGKGESLYGNEFFTPDQVLHAQLHLDESLARDLVARDYQGVCQMAQGDMGTGFLLTSQGKGLIFYSTSGKRSAVLEEGTWYRTWNMGGKYVSVGFPKGESSYGSIDLAFARVYEYDLSQLCNESMANTLREMEEEEESRRQEEEEKAKQSLEASVEGEEQETVQNPLDKWNDEYQQKYERTMTSGGAESGSEKESSGTGD